MTDYEIITESTTPCGGSAHAVREMIEATAESPEAYVKEHGRYPIQDILTNEDGDTVIITGDENGYMIRYTFTA